MPIAKLRPKLEGGLKRAASLGESSRLQKLKKWKTVDRNRSTTPGELTVYLKEPAEKEVFKRMEYKPPSKRFHANTRQLDLPNEEMCKEKRGELDSWIAEVFCPTPVKKKRGKK
jgi:hypothetical protein